MHFVDIVRVGIRWRFKVLRWQRQLTRRRVNREQGLIRATGDGVRHGANRCVTWAQVRRCRGVRRVLWRALGNRRNVQVRRFRNISDRHSRIFCSSIAITVCRRDLHFVDIVRVGIRWRFKILRWQRQLTRRWINREQGLIRATSNGVGHGANRRVTWAQVGWCRGVGRVLRRALGNRCNVQVCRFRHVGHFNRG